MIEGRDCVLLTDHKPLIHALARQTDLRFPRQQQHLSTPPEFVHVIEHRSGHSNVVADCLSCDPLSTITFDVDYGQDTREQPLCPELLNNRRSPTSSLRLQDCVLDPSLPPITCDISTRHPRPFVPVSLRRTIFSALHDLAHPGVWGTQALIGNRFVWPHMRWDIALWC